MARRPVGGRLELRKGIGKWVRQTGWESGGRDALYMGKGLVTCCMGEASREEKLMLGKLASCWAILLGLGQQALLIGWPTLGYFSLQKWVEVGPQFGLKKGPMGFGLRPDKNKNKIC